VLNEALNLRPCLAPALAVVENVEVVVVDAGSRGSV